MAGGCEDVEAVDVIRYSLSPLGTRKIQASLWKVLTFAYNNEKAFPSYSLPMPMG